MFRWNIVEGLPSVGTFEMGEGNARGDPEAPRAEDGRLAQEWELAEDLDRGLLQDVVSQVDAGKACDVAAQRSIDVAEEFFQSRPVSSLGEKDEKGLVEWQRLLWLDWGVHDRERRHLES